MPRLTILAIYIYIYSHSISYGELPDGYLDEMGGGNGVRLQLRTGAQEQAALVHRGVTLRARHLPTSALRGGWVRPGLT